ncbi:MAG: hypothetical protein KAT05_16255 [Spirochaetes bacterium]|nr:hypothetical protein [Spirochaetota bacterium]
MFITAYLGAYLAIVGNTPLPPPPKPHIYSWNNSQTKTDMLDLSFNTANASILTFNAHANQTIDKWNWYLDGVNKSNNYDNITFNMTAYKRYVIQVNATNINGTSNTVTWNVDRGAAGVMIQNVWLGD